MSKSQCLMDKILLSGNEAIALGALKAGLKFFAAYPMTPATSILHFLAAYEHQYKIIVKQTEDEISAMNMIIGASAAGARAMTATSGGGFSLMVEALGMAGMMEVPIVCAMVSRPGPSTGMPTWTGQGDFRFVLHAGQEEFPRIILAPGDAKECFDLTFKAFNLADRYQVPVLILSDKLLGESYFTVPVDDFQNGDFKIDRGDIVSLFHCSIVDEKGNKQSNNETMKQCNNVYKRYEVTKSGISKRAIPGTEGYVFLANSYEHDEFGFSEEDVDNRVRQMLKRMRKMETMIKDEAIDSPRWYGPKKADLTLICWGSTKGVCLENVKCQMSNVKCNVLHFNHIYPLNIDSIKKELAKIKKSICVEGNYSGQFADYLYEKTGYKCDKKLVKFDGRPWFVEDIMDKIKK